MDVLAVLLIAVGLAMDAFAVSVCKGLAMRRPTLRQIAVVGLWFGLFQGLMPVIGYFLGSAFYGFVSTFAYIIAFVLLLLIGANMIRESLSGEDEEIDDSTGFKVMLLLAIATSIDALAVGISFAMDGTEIAVPALIIGIVTAAISFLGVKLGSIVGNRYSNKAEFAGGVILILIGVKILLEGMGLF